MKVDIFYSMNHFDDSELIGNWFLSIFGVLDLQRLLSHMT